MRGIILLFFAFWAIQSYAQTYNNEWIDYSKTYYKFKVAADGLQRINQSAISGLGLGATPIEQFQLWRNGKQVPLFASKATGAMGGSDFLEFWGQRNDGKPDNAMYLNSNFQLSDYYSLYSDSSSYFLTVNPVVSGNQRYTAVANNVAGNSLPAETHFMHKSGIYFKERMNAGFAEILGDHFFSSSYDKGEGITSSAFISGSSKTGTLGALFPYTSGPASTLRLGFSGFDFGTKSVTVKLNNSTVYTGTISNAEYLKPVISISNTLLSSGSAVIDAGFVSNNPNDYMMVSHFELTYPRQFNFGGQPNFAFDLPANAAGNYLVIQNFNSGAATPVLYDITNQRRYTAVVDAGGIKFALQGSATARSLVLVSQDAGNLNAVTQFRQRNFINYGAAGNQGDYLIISAPVLFNPGGASNPVEQYRQYRSSAAGGSFNAKLVDCEQLEDQFAFGIRKHSSGIRNFIRYARLNYSTTPKYVFIIGKGVSYNEYRLGDNSPFVESLNLVPTWGFPGSDNLLSADPGSFIPTIPIGRLSAINTGEIQLYLDKVKEYETSQANSANTFAGKAWMKNVVHVTGASDEFLQSVLDSYMDNYRQRIEDTVFGANTTLFSKSNTSMTTAQANDLLRAKFIEGASLITYFGHSSATSLEYSLDDPRKYTNPGKYPFFIINGCNAGNLFGYNGLRLNSNEVISEKYVLAPSGGSIGFLASSNLGLVSLLHLMTDSLYDNLSRQMYGDSYGNIVKESLGDFLKIYGPTDFLSRVHVEQNTLHGDPALKQNAQTKPDYLIEASGVVKPGFVSTADPSFKLKGILYNIGKTLKDSVWLQVRQQYPDGSFATIYRQKRKAFGYTDSLELTVPVLPTRDKGLNRFTFTIDPDNLISELSDANNAVTADVTISDEEIRPVYPYNYGIVNAQPQKLFASTADGMSAIRSYVMELDTTALFNSALKFSQTISSKGGLLEFTPGFSFQNGTTYYWRTAAVPASGPLYWNNASFVYLAGSTEGFNQGHVYQHIQSDGKRIFMDSASRRWKYRDILNNLFIRSGIWSTSTFQEAEMSVSVNGDAYVRNACKFSGLTFNVFDPITFRPWVNTTSGGAGLYGSEPNDCFPGREYNFEYAYTDTASRRKMLNFLDNVVPAGHYIVVRNFSLNPAQYPSFPQAYAADWRKDTVQLGNGNSIYHRLKSQGFSAIDSFNRVRSFAFVYKKNDLAKFTPKFTFSDGIYDKITMNVDCPTPDTTGFITSPAFGPAKAWREVHWRGATPDGGAGDWVTLDVVGVRADNTEALLHRLTTAQQDFNISAVNAATYPYIKLRMRNADSIYLTPYQLNYWRLNYDPVPEGAVAPNIVFNQTPGSFMTIFDTLKVSFPFKNISHANFDSLKVKFTVIDKNNVSSISYGKGFTNELARTRPLAQGDTVMVNFRLPLMNFSGKNTLIMDVNPDNDQPEQFRFNNLLYRNFTVAIGGALPVRLLEFNARPDGSSSLLEWRAAVDASFSRFELEVSQNGLVFTPIGTILENDGDNTVRQYRFSHLSPVKGLNYYRIKLVKKDNSFEYSPIRLVSFGNRIELVKIAPNPFTDMFTVVIPSGLNQATVNAMLTDATGKLIERRQMQPGSHSFQMRGRTAGTYLLQIDYGAEKQLFKLEKL